MENICVFFGNRTALLSERDDRRLRALIMYLIRHRQVECFWVGKHGDFDKYVTDVLQEIRQKYPKIRVMLVLNEMPKEKEHITYDESRYDKTIYPIDMEFCIPRFSIVYKNRFMAKMCTYAVCYVATKGGASKAMDYAVSQKKTVVNIYRLPKV